MKVLNWVLISVVVIIGVIALMARFSIGGIELLSVQSGSMEPAIKTGGIVMTKSESSYSVGDIITFIDKDDPSSKITHRIYSIDNGLFQTRGDANEFADGNALTQEEIIGKVIFSAPYLGFILTAIRSIPGIIILIIIPATIIIYEEINKIRREAKNIKESRKSKKQVTSQNERPKKSLKDLR